MEDCVYLKCTYFSNTAKGVSYQIQLFSRRCCNETITLAEKYAQSGLLTNERIDTHALGESYYQLALFNIKYLKSESEANQLETSKLLIKSILRGMRHDSKNARLQFTRLLQLPNINSKELTDLFNQEVIQTGKFTLNLHGNSSNETQLIFLPI